MNFFSSELPAVVRKNNATNVDSYSLLKWLQEESYQKGAEVSIISLAALTDYPFTMHHNFLELFKARAFIPFSSVRKITASNTRVWNS